MFIARVEISNFRGISNLSLEFQDGLNVLIGENKTFKTAVIDAIRLVLGHSLERRDLYVQSEDFFIGSDGVQADTIEILLSFSGLSPQQQGVFVEMLSPRSDGSLTADLHLRFKREGDRIHRKLWGGDNEGQEVPAVVLELLYFTFLGALRDATRDLSPNRANRLSQLFLKLVPQDTERDEYATALNGQIRGIECWEKLLEKANGAIQHHLTEMVTVGDDNRVSIEFVDSEFRRIVEGLRIRIPYKHDTNSTPEPTESDTATVAVHDFRFTLAQNSLGFNNLLYIATVLGDLLERKKSKPASYASLLIEEPEAHLHPHWQNTLFRYLRDIEEQGFQVFITSHSPTITAKSSLDCLVALNRLSHGKVRATPLRRIVLSDPNKKYLQRFMDVTKSQLFFAKGVLIVEGISEALLMPAFARSLGADFDLDRNAVEIVNVGGVSFEPFAALFNSTDCDRRLQSRCAIISDDDRQDTGSPSSRAVNTLALKGGGLEVTLAEQTFEFELYRMNEEVALSVYKALHPETTFQTDGSVDDRALAFVSRLRSNKDKAMFAQSLAFKLQENGASLAVPEYIETALRWVMPDASSAN